jgi:hypothetical protein
MMIHLSIPYVSPYETFKGARNGGNPQKLGKSQKSF